MKLSAVYKPVQQDLIGVEEVIVSTLKDSENELVGTIGAFVAGSSGKRLRPAMVLLSAGACSSGQEVNKETLNVAAAMELMHIASLIHDDVIDAAPMRHNMPTINSKWADNIGIIFGDYVYSKAMNLVAASDNTDIFRCLSETVTSMCQGQLAQVSHRDNSDLSYDNYISIVSNKTASLFAVCCRVGALLAGAKPEIADSLAAYGNGFGIAYQIIDDYCDVVEHKSNLGKDPGQDILLGELTLPIMNLLAISDDNKKTQLVELLKSGTYEAMESIRQEFMESQAPEMTRKSITEYIGKARGALEILPVSDFRESLDGLLDIIDAKVPATQTAK